MARIMLMIVRETPGARTRGAPPRCLA
jgi:hypothetical protein